MLSLLACREGATGDLIREIKKRRASPAIDELNVIGDHPGAPALLG